LDSDKAAENVGKRGVSPEEAASAFFEPLSPTGDDPDHSQGEKHFLTFGLASSGRLPMIAHTERNQAIRIIGARLQESRM
jgi:uncharacterized DUF497 family protein